MNDIIVFAYENRSISVDNVDHNHYEHALSQWAFHKSIWGFTWRLLTGCGGTIEYTGPNGHATVDLRGVVAIQLQKRATL